MTNAFDPDLLIAAIDHTTNQRIAEAKRRNLGQHAEELALREAERAKRDLRATTISYEVALPTDPDTVRRPEHACKVIRMRGHLADMEEPLQAELPRTAASLVDLLGERANESAAPVVTTLMSKIQVAGEGFGTVETELFLDRQLVNKLQDNGHRFANWEFLLYVVPGTDHPRGGKKRDEEEVSRAATISRYFFFLIDARPLASAIQTVAPTPGEIEGALKQYEAIADVLDQATEQLVRLLGVVGGDEQSILLEAIRFQVLAAATEGQRGHSLIIGPPGVGKSLIHKAAKMVQPIFNFAMPTKVTEAGLIGDGSSRGGHRKPGLIPMSHTGAFSVEDFNQANSVKNQRLLATFTHVMAEGVVADASAAKAQYAAQVSIILDANRKSDVRRLSSAKQGFDRVVDDIGVPMNVLSRMTYIAEIPRDVRAQVRVAVDMLGLHPNHSQLEKAILAERVRLLQVYLALMRERHPNVSIPEQVREYMKEQLISACNTTEVLLQRHGEFADFMVRQSAQLTMLVEAHARMHNRGVAIAADVEAVFPFIWRKLDWVKTILFGGQADTQVVEANTKARRQLISLRLRGAHVAAVKPAQVRQRLGLHSASLETIGLDLQALYGEPDENGAYHVVTVEPAHA